MRHALSAMRMTSSKPDSRPSAALLVARLAHTAEQRKVARDTALRLIGRDEDSDLSVTHALQVLKDDLETELPYLASLGWGLRSLAAWSWAALPDPDFGIGENLARDTDPRVRRALASALKEGAGGGSKSQVREILAQDLRYSVRRLILD